MRNFKGNNATGQVESDIAKHKDLYVVNKATLDELKQHVVSGKEAEELLVRAGTCTRSEISKLKRYGLTVKVRLATREFWAEDTRWLP